MEHILLLCVHLIVLAVCHVSYPDFLARHSRMSKWLAICLFMQLLLAMPDILRNWATEYHDYLYRYQQLHIGWHCGSGDLILHLGGMWASMFAGDSLTHISQCCLAHDQGYDECIDKTQSDIDLKVCMDHACEPHDIFCQLLVSEFFSKAVIYFGFVAYANTCGFAWPDNWVAAVPTVTWPPVSWPILRSSLYF